MANFTGRLNPNHIQSALFNMIIATDILYGSIANNYDFDVCIIDPISPETTLSINPFAIEDPAKCASIIADVLKSMQQKQEKMTQNTRL